MAKSLYQTIMKSLEGFKLSEGWKKDRGRYIPLPASWLNGKRWEDELPEIKESEIDQFEGAI